jgi:hypothetical protein
MCWFRLLLTSLRFTDMGRVYDSVRIAQHAMRKEEIQEVLDELSACIELKRGLNVLIEQYGGLFPRFSLNIWDSDIIERLPCIEEKLHELGLSYGCVKRGDWIYFQIYDPKKGG